MADSSAAVRLGRGMSPPWYDAIPHDKTVSQGRAAPAAR
ncbi:hypothetical protein BRAS3843_230061 [Bradyrhizobium sp. STM 3843]|nr:hypothetical protein BRAS3843_230061 [Bradyrhizobium sp. STM 3843]